MPVNIGRRELIAALGGAAAWPVAARAQQPDRMRLIGALMSGFAASDPEAGPRVGAFQTHLQELGWIVDRNVQIDYRWVGGSGDRIRTFAAELVGLKPDVLLANFSASLEALHQQTRTIPIVFAVVADSVGQGFVQSMARPGGNITGFSYFESSMGGKWLELLKEIAPTISRVAVLFNPQTAPTGGSYFLRPIEALSPSFGLAAIPAPVHAITEIESLIAAFARTPGGLIVTPDAFTTINRKLIIEMAARYRLPAVYPFRYFARDGGLLVYGIDTVDLYRQAATYVDRIFKGAKPSELPVQAPVKFELVINIKTANALGIQVSPMLLARADEVIE